MASEAVNRQKDYANGALPGQCKMQSTHRTGKIPRQIRSAMVFRAAYVRETEWRKV